ncbi:MAG: hypothetical protein ACJAYC_000710 [Halieaceae bacterium]|jgi:hypothetical protein
MTVKLINAALLLLAPVCLSTNALAQDTDEAPNVGAVELYTCNYADHLTSRGSNAALWVFLPAFGAADVDGHYKPVSGYESYEEWGNDHSDYTNGGGWMKSRELMADVLACDTPRVYGTTLVRNGGVSAN